MQILILGNGFDIASGLPTSYQDFFTWRFSDIEDKLKLLFDKYENDILETPTKINLVGNVAKEKVILKSYVVKRGTENKSYDDIFDELKSVFDDLIMKKITYFDLYFYIAKKYNCQFNKWCDVENKVKDIIGNISTRKDVRKPRDIMEQLTDRTVIRYNSEEGIKDEIYHLYKALYIECLSDKKGSGTYQLLKQELTTFEKGFQKYISLIYNRVLSNPSYKNIYWNNYKSLLKENKGVYILNFNYTSIKDVAVQSDDIPKEINVHGKYSDNIILGIDQGVCETDNEYIFSKTYRKIENYSEQISLPRNRDMNKEQQTIVFYGHSLSEADYSYFQSIFDLYNLYHQTTIIVKYSIYDDVICEKIRGEVFRSVTTLLKNYGSTMDNKNHGNNLLHKLLLEGRLKFEEIKLTDMNFQLDDL